MSWAALFRKEILPDLPVRRLVKYYREGQGRPSKELYAAMGALLLQQMFDQTDEQTVEQFSFNLMWHYALGITWTADAEAYLSVRTLWTMRKRLIESGLDAELFEMTTKKLTAVFGVDTSRQRLDSTHLFSNMRHLGRIGLFAATIRRFLVNLRRQHRERFAEVGEDFTNRYVSKGDGVFSLVKPSEAVRKLETLGRDLLDLALGLEDFTIDDSGSVASCPQGHAPAKTWSAGKETTNCFAIAVCVACPAQLRCPVRWSEEGYVIRVTAKKIRLARRRVRVPHWASTCG